MKQFLILPHQEAKKAVEMYPGKLNVISVERNEPVNPKLCKNHLQLNIDDINDWHIERLDKELKQKGMIYAEKNHIIESIEFDKQHPVHIIHCHAGISRSPAIGYAILRNRGLSKSDAENKIKEIAPHSFMNDRIVRLTDEIFG